MAGLYATPHGEGHPVLVLHGGGLDHRHMLDAVEPVFEHRSGFQRVYVDLPGHGRSHGPDIRSQDDVVAAVRSFCDDRFDTPFAVVGESRGSLIARALVSEMPERLSGVCLLVPGGDTPSSEKPAHQILVSAPEVRETLPEAAIARFDRLVVQSSATAQKIMDTKLPANELADPEIAERLQASFMPSSPLEAAPFDKPSLIISGRQDAIAGFADGIAIQNTYPRATFAILDTAGHSLAWERPALFEALMHDWLDRLNAAL